MDLRRIDPTQEVPVDGTFESLRDPSHPLHDVNFPGLQEYKARELTRAIEANRAEIQHHQEILDDPARMLRPSEPRRTDTPGGEEGGFGDPRDLL